MTTSKSKGARLAAVKDTGRRARQGLFLRDSAIRAAHEAGCSLREIATAAGLSHQTISNILNRG